MSLKMEQLNWNLDNKIETHQGRSEDSLIVSSRKQKAIKLVHSEMKSHTNKENQDKNNSETDRYK